MKANITVIAGLLLALAFAAPTYAQSASDLENANPAQSRAAPARPVPKVPDPPCVVCVKAAMQVLQKCLLNARTNGEKSACFEDNKNAVASCNAGVCARR